MATVKGRNKKKRVEALQQWEVARVWTRIESGEQKKKKKKSPKEAQTPIEEDTYIYNVHVYGFFFVVENQKKT